MAKKSIYMVSITVVIIASLFYIDQRYFFNPVVFSQDLVTPHEWNDYERPLTMTYYNLDGQRQAHKIEEDQEIRKFLNALKNSPQSDREKLQSEVRGALKLSNKNNTLLEVYFYSDHWRVLKGDYPIYEITQNLESLVDQY